MQRFLLWIDSVGGYLVCRGDEVTLGQAVPESGVEVPILADISRRHATIRRDGEGYLLIAHGPTRVDGRPVAESAYLKDGALVELRHDAARSDTIDSDSVKGNAAGGVRLRFRRPHPLSATARLEFESRHRTQPPCDAVLLMAETCVLGAKPSAHVVCRDWPQEVILIGRGDQELKVRSNEAFQIDGRPQASPARLRANSQVSGESFSFSLEAV